MKIFILSLMLIASCGGKHTSSQSAGSPTKSDSIEIETGLNTDTLCKE